MNDTLLQINNLTCSYNTSPVLQVEQLNIPKNEVIFLLGASGSGKSTLLESLALMSNTMQAGDIKFHTPDTTISYQAAWKNNNEDHLSELRKKYFSFIFQSTNFMENFTAYENICLSEMIKKDKRQNEIIQKIKQLAQEVNLTAHDINPSTKTDQLSIGQQQRLAFVRAICNDFSIIFGDEPTGNLDEENANELLQTLKQNLNPGASAIIVSHDIDLALTHADRIICLKKNQQGIGEILPQHIFKRADILANPQAIKTQLRTLYKSSTQTPKAAPTPQSTTTDNNTYKQIFLKKESKALAGKNYINFGILTLLITLTLTLIGFSNGSLEYLKEKLDNAYVKWVSFPVPHAVRKNTDKIISKLQDPQIMKEFAYKTPTNYSEFPYQFFNTQNKPIYARGRSIDLKEQGNPLLQELLKKQNIIAGQQGFYDNDDLSIIVTQRFLQELNLPNNTSFLDHAYYIAKNDTRYYQRTPIPIRAIVKEIPGRNAILYTKNFLKTLNSNRSSFDLRTYPYIDLFVPQDKNIATQLASDIQNFLNQQPQLQKNNPISEYRQEHDLSFAKGHDLKISFDPELDHQSLKKIWENIETEVLPTNRNYKNIKRIYTYDPARNDYTPRSDAISLYFDDLQKIRAFADTFYYHPERFNSENRIEIDIAPIKEKENFDFLSTLIRIIAWLAIIFGTVSVSLFLFNLIKMHLNKAIVNIGTLKAFGLSNTNAMNIYFNIIVRFLLTSLLLSIVLATIIGYTLDTMLGIYLNKEEAYFNLFHLKTVSTILIILAIAVLAARMTIKNILSKPPSALIYQR